MPDEPEVAPDVVALLAAPRDRASAAPGDWTFRFDRGVLSLDGDGAGDLSQLPRRVSLPDAASQPARDSWVLDGAERARLAAARPGTAIEVFPGGHHFLVAQPAEVGAALRRFLDALVRTR